MYMLVSCIDNGYELKHLWLVYKPRVVTTMECYDRKSPSHASLLTANACSHTVYIS